MTGSLHRTVVLIAGADSHQTFADVIQYLRESPRVLLVDQFPDLPAAFRSGLGTEFTAELVVVLQTWSDQFRRDEINRLIGALPGSRIVCAWGPWCASDGRSHDLWPVACRIPHIEARKFLEALIVRDCSHEASTGRSDVRVPGLRRQHWSPLAAPEEVFAEYTALMCPK